MKKLLIFLALLLPMVAQGAAVIDIHAEYVENAFIDCDSIRVLIRGGGQLLGTFLTGNHATDFDTTYTLPDTLRDIRVIKRFYDGGVFLGSEEDILDSRAGRAGYSLASTGSDADTGLIAIKTKLTTIAGYTDDIGTAGAGLTALGDTRLANLDAAITSRLAPTTASRTLDVTSTGAAGIDWANIENPSTSVNLEYTTIRKVAILDEDSTILDVDGTTVGTVTNLTNAATNGDLTSVMKTSVNSVVPSTDAIATGVWGSTLTNKTVDVSNWKGATAPAMTGDPYAGSQAAKLAAGGTESDTSFTGLQGVVAGIKTKTDKLTYNAQDSLIVDYSNMPNGGSGSGWDGWPFLERGLQIDSAGAVATLGFVADTASLGTNKVAGLLKKIYVIKDTSLSTNRTIMTTKATSVSITGGFITVTLQDTLPFAVTKGDSVWLFNSPEEVFATLAEVTDTVGKKVLDSAGVSVFATDTSNTRWNGDATKFGAWLAQAGGTPAINWYEGRAKFWAYPYASLDDSAGSVGDTFSKALGTGTVNRLPRLTDLADTAKMARSVWDGDVIATREVTGGAVDTARNAGTSTSDTTAIKAMLYRNLFLRFGSLDSAQVEDSTLAMLRAIDSINIILDSLRSQTWATSGSTGSGSRSVTMYARDTINDVRVSGVTITMASGVSRYWGNTDLTGKVVFSLDDGTYTATGVQSPYTFVPRSVVVNGTEIDSVNGGGVTIPAPASPDKASVYWQVVKSDGSIYPYCRVKFTFEPTGKNILDTISNINVSAASVDTSTNVDGIVTVQLIKTGRLMAKSGDQRQKVSYRATAYYRDVIIAEKQFSIPSDSTTINLGELR